MQRPKLLLHICCAPDATYAVKLLENDYEVTGYFYNPNIQPEEEYEKRLAETGRLFKLWDLKLYSGEYNLNNWRKAIIGLENELEGGRRCAACFDFRLKKAAQFAKENGYDIFTTTLTISPHKNAALINELGQNYARQRGVEFLVRDLKKQNGFKKSIELSKELGLYRQDYCGCSFSKREREFSKLSRAIKSCRRCNLPEESYPIISGKWHNRVMLVGQAPGKKELELDKLFSGPAGKRLFAWLNRAGLEENVFRDNVYITAVMKCFPGPAPHGDRRPSLDELKNCASFLAQELKLIRPRLLIPVGQLAIQRFLGNRPLSEVVGRKFKKTIAGQRFTIIPLPHPSGASPWSFKKDNKPLLEKAIQLIKKHFKIQPQINTD